MYLYGRCSTYSAAFLRRRHGGVRQAFWPRRWRALSWWPSSARLRWSCSANGCSRFLFGPDIAEYVYLLQRCCFDGADRVFWFFGDLLIAVLRFQANFAGNVAAFVAVLPLSVVCVDLWDMNGVSFAGAAACVVGVAVLSAFLAVDIAKQRKLVRDRSGEDDAEDRHDARFARYQERWIEAGPRP